MSHLIIFVKYPEEKKSIDIISRLKTIQLHLNNTPRDALPNESFLFCEFNNMLDEAKFWIFNAYFLKSSMDIQLGPYA